MSSFTDLYPASRPGDTRGELLHSHVVGECRICGTVTAWEHGTLEAAVCSEECLRRLWQEAGVTDTALEAAAGFRETDLGNSLAFIAKNLRDVRYCPQWKRWLHWNGRFWEIDDAEHVMEMAKATVRGMYDGLEDMDSDKRARRFKHLLDSEGLYRLRAMVELSRSVDGVSVHPNELDADPYLLNVGNGTLDLRNGRLRGALRTDLLTKGIPTDYDPEAKAPRWQQFMRDTFPDPAIRAYMQRVAGYALTGCVSEQCLFFLHGGGENGKTAWVETLKLLLRPRDENGYAATSTPGLLIQGSGGDLARSMAMLQGVRLVSTSETSEGKSLNEEVVKHMTGGEPVPARRLYAEYFEYRPVWKIFLLSNHRPRIANTDHGIWRRIRLVPFEHQVEESRRVKDIWEVIYREEAEGLLAWAVRGAIAWHAAGRLGEPEAITEAVARYRQEQNDVGMFLLERCDTSDTKKRLAVKEVYREYQQWCQLQAGKALPYREFGRRLRDVHGLEKVHTRAGDFWSGITILNPSVSLDPTTFSGGNGDDHDD